MKTGKKSLTRDFAPILPIFSNFILCLLLNCLNIGIPFLFYRKHHLGAYILIFNLFTSNLCWEMLQLVVAAVQTGQTPQGSDSRG